MNDLHSASHHLVQIVDAAVADSVRRSGPWLACQPGCSQCCVGVFPITRVDAERLRAGLKELELTDPERATNIRLRVAASIELQRDGFPGDFESGVLDETHPAFEEFGNDLVCPVLDPMTRTCDLYSARPVTCRTFGPPIESGEGIGVCELCFVDATPETIKAALIDNSFLQTETELLAEYGTETTTIALGFRNA